MSYGFKEWALVCELLGAGEQSVILRKGGIAEGRAGFRFQHPEFLLFPTLFHEQAAKLRVPEETAIPAARPDGQIEIRYMARAEWTRDIDSWETAVRLERFHLWQRSEIEKRFQYDEKTGLSVAFVRVFRFLEPFLFPDSPKYGGCRSWVQLPDPPAQQEAVPVLDDVIHRERERKVLAALQEDAALQQFH